MRWNLWCSCSGPKIIFIFNFLDHIHQYLCMCVCWFIVLFLQPRKFHSAKKSHCAKKHRIFLCHLTNVAFVCKLNFLRGYKSNLDRFPCSRKLSDDHKFHLIQWHEREKKNVDFFQFAQFFRIFFCQIFKCNSSLEHVPKIFN